MQVKFYNNNNNNSDNNEEMHIIASDRHQHQQPPPPDAIILTKCTKMTTEEKQNIRYGMNGNAILDCSVFTKDELSSSPVTTATKTTTTTTTTSYPPGGRLKFFKDGKFILELERAREGERISWVSVPRKTFWPPQGTAASTPTYRQESSTSLSVSDDNSSIQSSPWQRDHSWKQQQPRRNQSDGLSFYFWRHPQFRPQFTIKNKIQIKQKCRRPYYCHNNNNSSSSNDNNNSDNDDNTTTIVKNSVCNNNNDNYQVNNNSNNNNKHTKLSLLKIIQNLIDSKTINNEKPCNNIVTTTAATCRVETVVSPRKRFLREMEKDKIPIDDNCLKRSRNKTPIVTCSGNNNNNVNNNNNNSGQVTIIKNSSSPPVRLNGDDVKIISSSSSSGSLQHNHHQQQKNCSYSITSLLAEDRAVRRSPNNSPSRYNSVTQFGSSTTTTTTTTSSPSSSSSSSSSSTITPGTEDRLYSENVDRLRSIELSQADKRAYQAAAAAAAAAAAYPNYLPFMYPYSLPPQYYNPGMYSGRNYMVPSIYHHHAAAPPLPPPPPPPTLPHHHHHHHQHPHHTPQSPLAPVQMALRHNPIDGPSYPWTTDSIRGTENDQRDDNDMPLNLSKHAG